MNQDKISYFVSRYKTLDGDDYFTVAYDKSAEHVHAAILNMVKKVSAKRSEQEI